MDNVWKSKIDFLDQDANDESKLMQNNLSQVSTEQIKSLKDKTCFYLTHYTILSRKTNCESSGLKVSFLRKLHRILDTEIRNRAKGVLL